jgi:PleD family two-component response regulator
MALILRRFDRQSISNGEGGMGTTNHYDVLLVEDSSSDVELIFHVLRKHSIPAVCVAHDGQEALDLLFADGGGNCRRCSQAS